MKTGYTIRKARETDLETLIAFTLEEAWEAEGARIGVDAVRRGVETGLMDPKVAEYWVAEATGGEVIAAASVVTEWSNFHGGYYWWVQSLFIAPDHRGRGLVDLLLDHLADTAQAAGALDLRLYVHESNHRAIHAYRRCGFGSAPYTIMVKQWG
jgi:ribosomal protein S18 acetylase RimI-like enzyme